MTLLEWFAQFAEETSESPTHIVLRWDDWRENNQWPELPQGVTRFDKLDPAILDRKFDDGYGGNESPNLCAWSQHWVLFSDDYDGAEGLRWVPRAPVDHEPIRPGGG